MKALNNMNYIKIVIFYNRQKLDITLHWSTCNLSDRDNLIIE
jgi:hypothetical protein